MPAGTPVYIPLGAEGFSGHTEPGIVLLRFPKRHTADLLPGGVTRLEDLLAQRPPCLRLVGLLAFFSIFPLRFVVRDHLDATGAFGAEGQPPRANPTRAAEM